MRFDRLFLVFEGLCWHLNSEKSIVVRWVGSSIARMKRFAFVSVALFVVMIAHAQECNTFKNCSDCASQGCAWVTRSDCTQECTKNSISDDNSNVRERFWRGEAVMNELKCTDNNNKCLP